MIDIIMIIIIFYIHHNARKIQFTQRVDRSLLLFRNPNVKVEMITTVILFKFITFLLKNK